MPASNNYSYSDGDIRYSWSPDSKWLAFSYLPTKRWIDNVGVARADGGEPLNVTKSGYYEGDPQWSADGRALTFSRPLPVLSPGEVKTVAVLPFEP